MLFILCLFSYYNSFKHSPTQFKVVKAIINKAVFIYNLSNGEHSKCLKVAMVTS